MPNSYKLKLKYNLYSLYLYVCSGMPVILAGAGESLTFPEHLEKVFLDFFYFGADLVTFFLPFL
jgi:hypothetical protein